MLRSVHRVTFSAILKESIKLLIHFFGLCGIFPHGVPVSIGCCRGTCTNDVQNVLGSGRGISQSP